MLRRRCRITVAQDLRCQATRGTLLGGLMLHEFSLAVRHDLLLKWLAFHQVG